MGRFGPMLRKIRKEHHRTLADLSRWLGVSIPYVSDVERGNRAPFPVERIRLLARELEVEPDDLMAAAAEDRGAFELRTDGVSEQGLKVGAALMRRWSQLTDEQLQRIEDVLDDAPD